MERISKSQIKLVRSLQQKKFRDETGLFVAEGEKCVEELRKGFELVYRIQSNAYPGDDESLSASTTEIEQMSGLRAPQGVIGVFRKRAQASQSVTPSEGLALALDGIQDPGNLGTIIRTADWFGVREIFCSADTADCYNPKVVQATMGALARVKVHYVDLPAFIRGYDGPVYGTLLDGKSLYSTALEQKGLVVMGNEGNGLSAAVRALVTHPLRIPSYPAEAETSESLNVSIATGIVLAEFRRVAR